MDQATLTSILRALQDAVGPYTGARRGASLPLHTVPYSGQPHPAGERSDLHQPVASGLALARVGACGGSRATGTSSPARFFPEFSADRHIMALRALPDHWARFLLARSGLGSACSPCMGGRQTAAVPGQSRCGCLVRYRERQGMELLRGEPNVGLRMTAGAGRQRDKR